MFKLDLPELQLLDGERTELLSLYETWKVHEIQYRREKSGTMQDLWLLGAYERTPLINRLQSKVRYVRQSYFLKNKGIEPHRDDNRTAVISFELINPENLPTRVYDDESNLVGVIHYDNMPVLWSTQRLHDAEWTSEPRLFFQMELERENSFEYYAELYQTGDLFRW